MIKYFQNRFALSEKGAKDLSIAILWSSLLNIALMLPVIVAFMFLEEYVRRIISPNASAVHSILFYVGLSALFFLLMYVIAYFQYNATYTKIYNESADRRIKLAETLRKLPLAYFGRKNVADLSGVIMEDATQIEQLFSHAVPQLFAAIISLSLMSVGMFFYNWQMTLAMLWVVPLGLLIFYAGRKMMQRGHKELYDIKRGISDEIQEGLTLAQEIKSYNQEAAYINGLNKQLQNYEKRLIKIELLGGALLNISHFTLKLGLAGVALIGAYLLSTGAIPIFVYLVFLVIAARIYDPFIEVMNNFAVLLYLKERIARMKEMDAMPRQEGSVEFAPSHFDIEFKNVDFSYQEGMPTLRNVSFTAKQGEVTALIGPSGGGKSTVAKLCARFWDADKGVVALGGINVSDIDPETLLKNYSIVFQDVALFNSSVLENIRLGKKEASDEQVMVAARLAECDDFASKLPQGYHTLVGENGARLSGGERQRISIARALLKDAPVILLDEATASLDAENETKIQRAISNLVKNKTVLIIAHRMRTVIGADKIVAIKDGQVAEMGSPAELKTKNGVFSSMLEKQMREKN